MSIPVDYDIKQTGGANVEEAFRAINSGIIRTKESAEKLRGVFVNLKGQELFPSWRESATTIDYIKTRMESLQQGFNSAKVGSSMWETFNKELAKTANEMQLVKAVAAEMLDPVGASTSVAIHSLDALTQKLSYYRSQMMRLGTDTPAFDAMRLKVAATEAQLAKFNVTVSQTTKRTGDYNMVGVNTARLFSDAGYAAQSFSFGVMSIGNNISPLVESIQRARSAGQSWKELLVSTFTGISGGLVAINILVSAITAYSIASSKASSQQKEQETTLKSLIDSYRDFSDVIRKLNSDVAGMTFSELETSLGRLEQKLQDLNKIPNTWIDDIWTGLTMGARFSQNEFLREIGTTPNILGSPKGKYGFIGEIDQKEVAKTEAGVNAIKKQYSTLKNVLSEPMNFGTTGERELKNYLNLITNTLSEWGKDIKRKNLSPKDQLGRDILDVGTFDRSQVEKIRKQLDEYLKPNKPNNKPETDKNWDDVYKSYEERLKLQTQYYEQVTYGDSEYFQWLTEQWVRTSMEMNTQGLDGNKWYNEQVKKEDEKYFKWLKENDPRYKDLVSVAVPKKPNMLAKTDDDLKAELYSKTLTEFGRLGSNLRTIFRDAGDSFLGKMIETLNVVTAIAEVIKSIEAISTFFKTISFLGAPLTGGASLAGFTASDFASGALIPKMSAGNGGMQTVNYDVNIGGEKIARITAKGYQVATELRYL
jgi:hypothetical protein